MNLIRSTICVFVICISTIWPATGVAQTTVSKSSLVDFELMTWPEVKQALAQGKTTALIFNGGTEQRGPQGVNGAHSLIARVLGVEIAQRLGNAILAPVIPYSVNNASADLPGTIGITGPVFAALNEQVAEQMIVNGFKNIVLMGDHGGGQTELGEVAKKLDAKYSSKGIRVVYCNDVYDKVGTDFNKWLTDNHLPVGSHASIKDTSELLYLGGDKGWIRKDEIATAVGNSEKRGATADPNVKRVSNGISGDARGSTPEIGKRVSDMKVDYAVHQIRELLNQSPTAKTATATARK
jgi:creatinine amidohydrolase